MQMHVLNGQILAIYDFFDMKYYQWNVPTFCLRLFFLLAFRLQHFMHRRCVSVFFLSLNRFFRFKYYCGISIVIMQVNKMLKIKTADVLNVYLLIIRRDTAELLRKLIARFRISPSYYYLHLFHSNFVN